MHPQVARFVWTADKQEWYDFYGGIIDHQKRKGNKKDTIYQSFPFMGKGVVMVLPLSCDEVK